jgi:Lipocalin-like domain
MAVSFFPNWLGQKQVRVVEIDGERLQLSTDGPQAIFSGSLKAAATLTWRRAQPN